MRRHHAWPVLLVAAIACSQTGGLSSEESATAETLANWLAAVQSGRVLSGYEAVVPDEVLELRLPPTAEQYGLSQPVGVVLSPIGGCHLIVGDQLDQALHIFQLDGTYIKSISTRRAFQGSIASVGGTGDGAVFAVGLQLGAKVMHRWDRTAAPQNALVLGDPPAPGKIVRSQILVTPKGGEIVEHWFAQDYAIVSSGWPSLKLPLVRVYSPSGELRGSVGALDSFPGVTMNAALNRGIIDVATDTIWFAQTATGRVRGFLLPVGTAKQEQAVAAVDLPLLYDAQPPLEMIAPDGEALHVVQRHLTGFAVTPSGRHFVLGQVTGYPADRDALFRPRSVVSVYERLSGRLVVVDFNAEVSSVEATERWVIVRLYRPEPSPGQASVVRFRNPFDIEATPHGICD